MKTNLSLFMALCAVIFINSAMGMEDSSPKSYKELKESFKSSRDWNFHHLALHEAEGLQKCFQDSAYQDKQVEVRKAELKESSDFARIRAKFFGAATAVMAAPVMVLSLMKKKVGLGLKTAMLVPAASSLYNGVQSGNFRLAANQVTEYNAFDNEKEWLIKEVKSINPALKTSSTLKFLAEQRARELAEQRAKEFAVEFTKTLEEKKAELRS